MELCSARQSKPSSETYRPSLVDCARGLTAVFTGPPSGLGFQENLGSAAPVQRLFGGGIGLTEFLGNLRILLFNLSSYHFYPNVFEARLHLNMAIDYQRNLLYKPITGKSDESACSAALWNLI
jgi:hypothetical protein